jgi:hypothetical protein
LRNFSIARKQPGLRVFLIAAPVLLCQSRYSTVKLVALFAVPPGEVTEILPVTAPVGTVVVICVSDLTVNVAALVPNFTDTVWVKLVPVRTTDVPTGPLGGEKLMSVGTILNFCGETRLPPGSSTVMTPVVAPVAGFATM